MLDRVSKATRNILPTTHEQRSLALDGQAAIVGTEPKRGLLPATPSKTTAKRTPLLPLHIASSLAVVPTPRAQRKVSASADQKPLSQDGAPIEAALKEMQPTLMAPSQATAKRNGSVPKGQPSGSQAVALIREVHVPVDTHTSGDLAGNDRAHSAPEHPQSGSPVVAEIREMWRLCSRWRRAHIALLLQSQAVCRALCDGDKAAAKRMWEKAQKGDMPPALAVILRPFIPAIEGFAQERKMVERRLVKLGKTHPLWPWVSKVRGFGEMNFAVLIGEAGEIAGYRNPSCLWKRMGLAVIDGERQRKVSDTEQAKLHGYNPRRRATAFVLGECLLKGKGSYKAVYDERKEIELTRVQTKKHAHHRAMRYMVKRVLRDMWVTARTP